MNNEWYGTDNDSVANSRTEGFLRQQGRNYITGMTIYSDMRTRQHRFYSERFEAVRVEYERISAAELETFSSNPQPETSMFNEQD